MWPPVTNKGPDSLFQEMGSNTGVTVLWNWDCGWGIQPRALFSSLINIKQFLYEMTTDLCLCIYILMFYHGITEGFSKMDEDLLNDQLISHLQLHLESDKTDAS